MKNKYKELEQVIEENPESLMLFVKTDVLKDLITRAKLQERSASWGEETFAGMPHWKDPLERGRRFLEEALELAQSVGVSKEDADQLVKYTFGRPVGETAQEIGGVMHTLFILAEIRGLSVEDEARREMERCELPEVREKIRKKQVSKKLHGIGGTVPIEPDIATDSLQALKDDPYVDMSAEARDHGLSWLGETSHDLDPEILCSFNPEIPRKVGKRPGLGAPYGRDPRCILGDHDWYEPVGSHGMTQRCSRKGCPEGNYEFSPEGC